jgi:hypothetical protein
MIDRGLVPHGPNVPCRHDCRGVGLLRIIVSSGGCRVKSEGVILNATHSNPRHSNHRHFVPYQRSTGTSLSFARF